MSRSRRTSAERRRDRSARRRVALALCAVGLFSAACGTTAATPTTTSIAAPTGKVLSIAQLRELYLKDSASADAAFASFTAQFSGSGNNGAGPKTASPAEASAASRTAKVLQQSANELYVLSNEAPAAVRADLKVLIAAESPVFQALLDLAAGYRSRAFDVAAWATSLGNAAALTDQAAQKVAQDLKIPAASANS